MIEQPDLHLHRARIQQGLAYILFVIALVVLASESFVARDERVIQGVLLLTCWLLLLISALLRFRADHHRTLATPELTRRSPSAVESAHFLECQRRSKRLQRIAGACFAIALGGSFAKLFVPIERLIAHTLIEGGTFTAFFVGMMVGVVSRHYRHQSER